MTRSIWRETKLLLLLMTTGFMDTEAVLSDFKTISRHLSVEKRQKLRLLQMHKVALS